MISFSKCHVPSMAVLLLLLTSPCICAAIVGGPLQLGEIGSVALREVSGIVDSRSLPHIAWVHNDSGDSARFFAINHKGTLRGIFTLQGASSTDWEDIAIGPGQQGGNYLYLGDIGDNSSSRSSISVHRTAEPGATASAIISANDYSTARLRYPDGPRNSESLLVDPLTNDLYLITKSSNPQIYSATDSAFTQSLTVLTSHGRLGSSLSTPTAADISEDGLHILVRNRTTAMLFERSIGQSVADALRGHGKPYELGAERQGEAIAWASDGSSFFSTSEFAGNPSAPIYNYSFMSVPGDYNADDLVDEADYVTWRQDFGSLLPLRADANHDGMVDAADYTIWRDHLGVAINTSNLPSAVVPEPKAGLLLLMATLKCVPFSHCFKLMRAGKGIPNLDGSGCD